MATVGRWSSVQEADEHALVVLAMNRSCRVRGDDRGFILEVDPDDAEPVSRELSIYGEEQEIERNKPLPSEMPVFSAGLELAFVWAVVLGLIYLRQLANPALTENFLNSSLSVFIEGEWWRPFTALFLHADAEHLIGNIAIGGFFCLLVATAFGPLRGWLLILITGYLGNLLNAWIHMPDEFRSLGASTATFGALGLVVGHGVIEAIRTQRYGALKALLIPLGAGASLFGWFGVGGADTDVSAHLLGTMFGLMLGVAISSFIRPTKAAEKPV